MPVLATLVAIHVLGESEQNSLVDPRAMRRQARDVLADSPSLPEVLALIERLDELAADYAINADAALAAYKTKTSEWDSSKQDLLAIIGHLDEERRDALVEVVATREALRELVTPREWRALFS